jgi:polar amino acid transport system permease protein
MEQRIKFVPLTAKLASTSGASVSGVAGSNARLPIARRYHVGRWVSGTLVLLIFAWFATNPTFKWSVVGEYLFQREIIRGMLKTLMITLISETIGIFGGLVLALFRLSANPVLRGASGLYIWIFRGVPVLVQLIIWYNLGLVFPQISLQLPFTSVTLASWPTNSLLTPFLAVLLGLGLNEAAYMAEIIRSGLQSVPVGQREAAMSLGMTPAQTLRKVIIPPALRVIIPPTSNQLVIMLKISALASVVTYQELTTTAQNIYSVNLHTMELLVVASIWYVALTTVFTIIQGMLERRMGRSLARTNATGNWSRVPKMAKRKG